jgi:hypothetical protein
MICAAAVRADGEREAAVGRRRPVLGVANPRAGRDGRGVRESPAAASVDVVKTAVLAVMIVLITTVSLVGCRGSRGRGCDGFTD